MTTANIARLTGFALSVLLIGCVTAYIKGRVDGDKLCTAQVNVSYKEGVKKNADIDKQTNRMGESDIDRALTRWMH